MLPKRVFIIDAHAFLHRSYHALPKFSTSKGEEVGALYGFTRILLKILRERRPDYVAVCFDSKGGTFRDDLFREYKANRPATEPGLIGQLNTARDLVKALGLKGVYLKGYEADDIIATLARRAVSAGLEAVIVSGDKDAAQLAGEKVKLWDGSSPDFSGPEDVFKKYGLPPALLPDYFALTGDSSDNVPGVAGVGPKSAAKLVQTYGPLEKILAAAMDPALVAADKALAKVARDMENARLSRRLVTLEADAPVEEGLDIYKPAAPGGPELEEMARRLEFKELLALAGAAPAPQKPAELPPMGEACEILKTLSGTVAFAAFADGLAIGSKKGVCILSPGLFNAEIAEKAASVLADPEIPKVVFGVKSVMRLLGLPSGFTPGNFVDAEAAAALLSAGTRRVELPQMVFERLGLPRTFAVEAAAKVRGLPLQPPGSNEEKAQACAALPKLWDILKEELEKSGMTGVYTELELPLLPAVYSMEQHGAAVDTGLLGELSSRFEKKLAELQAESERLTGAQVNLNSPKQVGFLLYEKLNLGLEEAQKKQFKNKEGGYSTGEEALQYLKAAHPVVPLLLEYREISKLKSSFVDNLLAAAGPDGRLHTTFDQLGTATGRFSSSKPNLQNIPARSEAGLLVRKCFTVREGFVMLSADYSQIDLRVLAHLSGDRNLTEAFLNGEDIHLRTAAEVFNCAPLLVTPEMRRAAKAINFGIVYGQTPTGLSRELGISRGEAASYIKHYFEVCPGVKEWSDRTLDGAKKSGFVSTFTGRRRPLPELKASNPHLRGFAERAAVNTPVQGGSADIIKKAMVRLFEGFRHSKDVFMLLQVHDELVFEVRREGLREAAALIRKEMEQAYPLAVPLKADLKVGPNWRDMERI
ncbi:MAG: DNA polymerase I [Elusimicrobiota bacterium]|nr:DNA polymerase I [Elusimicrobiota bacterium]